MINKPQLNYFDNIYFLLTHKEINITNKLIDPSIASINQQIQLSLTISMIGVYNGKKI
jgi:hypothetical protein